MKSLLPLFDVSLWRQDIHADAFIQFESGRLPVRSRINKYTLGRPACPLAVEVRNAFRQAGLPAVG